MPPATVTAIAVANRTFGPVSRLYGVVALLVMALWLTSSGIPDAASAAVTVVQHPADTGSAAHNPLGGGVDGDVVVPGTTALQPSLPAHESAPASPAEPDDNRETAVRLIAGVARGSIAATRFSTPASDRRRARSGRGPPLA